MFNLYQIYVINEDCKAEPIGIAGARHSVAVEHQATKLIQDRYAYFVRQIGITHRQYPIYLLPRWRDRLELELVKPLEVV